MGQSAISMATLISLMPTFIHLNLEKNLMCRMWNIGMFFFHIYIRHICEFQNNNCIALISISSWSSSLSSLLSIIALISSPSQSEAHLFCLFFLCHSQVLCRLSWLVLFLHTESLPINVCGMIALNAECWTDVNECSNMSIFIVQLGNNQVWSSCYGMQSRTVITVSKLVCVDWRP